MKWRRILVVWGVLSWPLGLYNILGDPLIFPIAQAPSVYSEQIADYDFTVDKPILAKGNFSVLIPIGLPPVMYKIFAYVLVSEHYETYGADGAFGLVVDLNENGLILRTVGNVEDNVLTPPILPSGSGLAASGPLPFNHTVEDFTDIHGGSNIVGLNTFASLRTIIGRGTMDWLLDRSW